MTCSAPFTTWPDCDLATAQMHEIFSLRTRYSVYPQRLRSWTAVSERLRLSTYKIRKARKSKAYLECAISYFLAKGYYRGFPVFPRLLRDVGCLHPDTDMPPPDTSFVRDDAGRAEWKKSDAYLPMCADSGDCGTRAIVLALKALGRAQSYSTICRAVIDGKERLYGNATRHNANPWGYDEDWLLTNHGTPQPILEEILHRYTGSVWTSVPITAVYAGIFKGIRICAHTAAELLSSWVILLQTESHIAAGIAGAVVDSWDSRFHALTQIVCKVEDVKAVFHALRNDKCRRNDIAAAFRRGRLIPNMP